MSESEFPVGEDAAEAETVGEPLPSKACLEFDEYTVKVEPDTPFRVEVWRKGDAQPLYSQPGFQSSDTAMLAGLVWYMDRCMTTVVAVQNEIDKRTP